MDDPWQECLNWLALLEWIAARPRIEVRRGRDEVALKTLVAILPDLYRATAGEEACRVYRLVETRCSGPFGEGGDLLYLARPFVSYADEKAPRIGMTQPPSLARIVRQTLGERRAAMLTSWAGNIPMSPHSWHSSSPQRGSPRRGRR